MIAFMLGVGCLAVALLHLGRLAVPPRTDLTAEVGRWDRARARASRVQPVRGLDPEEENTLGRRAGVWLAEQARRRASDLTGLNQDLAISGSTLEGFLSKSLALAVAGFVAPLVLVMMMNVLGLGLPVLFVPIIAISLSAAMIALALRDLRENASRRRADFRRGLSIYLDLVAMSMQAGRGHSEALPAAAQIGSGWPFTELQDAIDGARFAGITPWAALGRLGDRVGMQELTDLDSALRLTNDDGAKIRATLVARAETLRERRIADNEAGAAQATESMKFALIVMVFAFLGYQLYPSVARLFAG